MNNSNTVNQHNDHHKPAVPSAADERRDVGGPDGLGYIYIYIYMYNVYIHIHYVVYVYGDRPGVLH